MKFKVTRNEPLEKAMNKANLVLVEVPVNTKKGQHRSHRWKRAIDALDQLFEDLGKKANSEDIAFIDKNTNKKVNKDELIKDYKKRGKKENKTLQTFVAENYKVSTKENGKEEELTVNNKNTDNNKSNATEDIKETEAPKEKIVTMAARNKYKQEKFYGTFKCGHEGEVYTGGYSDEYRQQAADDKFHHELCPHCEQKRIEEEREKEREEARKVAGELNLPELEGSEKQINWALSIRNKVVEDLKPSIDYAEKIIENEPSNKIAKAYVKMGKDFLNITDSAKWIDYRDLDFKVVMVNIISGYDWRDISWYGTFLSDDRRLDKDFLFDYKSLPKFENVEAERNKDYLCDYINDGIKNYLQMTLNKEETHSSEMEKWINEYQSIAENTDDELFYESLESNDFYILGATKKYRGKLLGGLDHQENLMAYKRRNKLIRDFLKEKKKGNLTGLEVEMLDNFLKNCVTISGYSESYTEGTVKEFAQKLTRTYKKITDKKRIDKLAAKGGLKRLGTKRIESKGEYKKTSNFEDLRTNLEKLKGLHTDTVARAAMDMAGIDAPLYVRRNDSSIKLSPTSSCAGYCQYDYYGNVKEIAVSDFTSDRAHSYKTTIHEVMHGLLAQTTSNNGVSLASKMQKNFNEGIVEMIGTASMKKAYGKEYRSQDRRTYVDYVVDTCLRLKRMNQFKGKTFSQIADTLGNVAFNRDWDNLSRINDYLEQSYNASPDMCSLNEGYNDIDKMEKSAKKRFADEHNGDMTNFEKTQIAMLVDRLKNTDFTLEQALESGQYRELAAVLIYNMLEDEDDELLGLL